MSLPQLRMRRWNLQPLSPPGGSAEGGDKKKQEESAGVASQVERGRGEGWDLPPPDPRVRPATHADVPEVAQVLTAAFGESWDETKVRAELLDHPGVPQTFVAVEDGRVLATASYQLQPELPTAGWVHWVGADPVAGGRRLGRAVTLAVLWAAQRDGKTDAGLTTDDARLPAIRTYLGLGFEPDPWHESHPARWEAILAQLHPSTPL